MRVAGMIRDSVVNGIGIRDVVFLQGCPHHCQECHNKETWNVEGGIELGAYYIFDKLKDSPNNLTISGGEPLIQLEELERLLYLFYLNSNKTVWLYTGYKFEEISILTWEKLAKLNVEVVVDGEFEIDKKDLTLEFRGSSNQRLIDLKKTIKKGEIVLWENTN